MKEFYDTLPGFYDWRLMTYAQAYSRGFHQGHNGHGPFGIYHGLEEAPDPDHALKVSFWLKGWAKGRFLYLAEKE